MRPLSLTPLLLLMPLLLLAACGEKADLPVTAGQGPSPTLPAPKKTPLPTVNFAKVVGWAAGEKPVPAAGLAVAAFADGLAHPRWLYTLPNGDVLVAETNGPPRPEDEAGIMGKIAKFVMTRAGAMVDSPNRIILLRDADGDGVAELKTSFLTGLYSPFGMVLVGNDLFVAEADKLTRFAYVPGATAITSKGFKLADLPGGARNHHWTKNVVAAADGKTLYVAVGSNSNVAENGLAAEKNRAAILAINAATGATQVFATGLRNPVGMAWNPVTGELWASVNERDELGSDLVPDYLTLVEFGGNYGWPWYYWGGNVDPRVPEPDQDIRQYINRPDYALGPHVAALGLTFAAGAKLGPAFANGAFIGLHGSWNRRPLSGYKVIFVPFAKGRPKGMPVDVLRGFLNADEQARGRPVGVVIDSKGALLVADDVGNRIWRVTTK